MCYLWPPCIQGAHGVPASLLRHGGCSCRTVTPLARFPSVPTRCELYRKKPVHCRPVNGLLDWDIYPLGGSDVQGYCCATTLCDLLIALFLILGKCRRT